MPCRSLTRWLITKIVSKVPDPWLDHKRFWLNGSLCWNHPLHHAVGIWHEMKTTPNNARFHSAQTIISSAGCNIFWYLKLSQMKKNLWHNSILSLQPCHFVLRPPKFQNMSFSELFRIAAYCDIRIIQPHNFNFHPTSQHAAVLLPKKWVFFVFCF